MGNNSCYQNKPKPKDCFSRTGHVIFRMFHQFVRKSQMEPELTIGNALVTTCAPFRFLDISRSLGSVIEYTSQEATGRTINLLFGPETNTKNLISTISCIADDSDKDARTIRNLKIYNRSGASYLVDVVCTPFMFNVDGSSSACCLTFKRPGNSHLKPAAFGKQGSSEQQDRNERRSRHNFLTGLDLNGDTVHQQDQFSSQKIWEELISDL